MLRAKARTDGFAIAPDAAAAMTRELLDLLRGTDACTALGPHLAALAAAVAAAGGAETLGALVDEAVAYAAPDARGGWPTPDEVKNGARAATVGRGRARRRRACSPRARRRACIARDAAPAARRPPPPRETASTTSSSSSTPSPRRTARGGARKKGATATRR